jgi:tRNA pseudouridine55 synthase
MKDINGILVIDKPAGWTSHDVVKKVKNLLGGKIKVGHTGTLDPMATGVLILLIGKATKSARLFENDDKRYRATVTFGTATDTYDSEGEITKEEDPSVLNIDTLMTAVDSFRGIIKQVPPMYSAKKVGGQKLYKIARKGKEVKRKPHTVHIKKLDAEYSDFPNVYLDILCSKGTYIRSIAHDLGEKIGCPAHLSELMRTEAGEHSIDEALDFREFLSENPTGKELVTHLKPVPTPHETF